MLSAGFHHGPPGTFAPMVDQEGRYAHRKGCLGSVLTDHPIDGRRRPGCGVGRCRGIEGNGRRHADIDHLLGHRTKRCLRPEQGHRRADGPRQRHADHSIHPHPQPGTGQGPECAGVPRDRTHAAADGAGRAAAGARRVQPEHHRDAGRRQLDAGAQHLDHAVGLPEGGGRQQRHRAEAGRPAGRLVHAGELQVTVGADLHRHGLHRRPESRGESGNAGRECGGWRPAGRVRVFELSDDERRPGPGAHRPAPVRDADLRRQHHVGHTQSRQPRRAADGAAAGRRRASAPARRSGGGRRTAAGGKDRRRGVQDRRQLRIGRRRHGRSHPGGGERSERCRVAPR